MKAYCLVIFLGLHLVDLRDCTPTLTDAQNDKPVIGILAQEPNNGRMTNALNAKKNDEYWGAVTSYIASAYVKSITDNGGRVVPIMLGKSAEYYEKMFNSLNGFIFPGGGKSSRERGDESYGRAGSILYKHIMAANENDVPTPLWGTCMGFQMIMNRACGEEGMCKPTSNSLILERCDAYNRVDKLEFSVDDVRQNSKMFQGFPEEPVDLIKALEEEEITSNFHKYCVREEKHFNKQNLNDEWTVLATSKDGKGKDYVATVEHKTYPVFGTQWHQEKPPYENKSKGNPITENAQEVTRYLMEMFVGKAKENKKAKEDLEEGEESPKLDDVSKYLICKHKTRPITDLYSSGMRDIYFFTTEDHSDLD